MKVLYDTSVLVAALLVNHPNHSLTFPKLEMVQRRVVYGYLSTHSLAELYSVLTRLPKPLRVFPDEAQTAIAALIDYFEAVPLLVKDYQSAFAQMVALDLPGGGVFDAVIAQAALKAEVDRILTFNPQDFVRLGNAIAQLVQVPDPCNSQYRIKSQLADSHIVRDNFARQAFLYCQLSQQEVMS